MNHWTIIFVIFTLLKTTIASADKIDAFSTPSYYSIKKPATIKANPIWNRFKILIWPYQTDVVDDFDLYQQIGAGGFQIDRGQGNRNRKGVRSSFFTNLCRYIVLTL